MLCYLNYVEFAIQNSKLYASSGHFHLGKEERESYTVYLSQEGREHFKKWNILFKESTELQESAT